MELKEIKHHIDTVVSSITPRECEGIPEMPPGLEAMHKVRIIEALHQEADRLEWNSTSELIEQLGETLLGLLIQLEHLVFTHCEYWKQYFCRQMKISIFGTNPVSMAA